MINYGISNRFCAGENLTLTSSAALSYQWLKDGIEISESNLQSIIVTESGAYTVVVDYGQGPVASIEIIITQANQWNGAANDGNWSNPANWTCGQVPLSTDLVIIDDTTSAPIISYEQLIQINRLQIDGIATLRVESGSTLMVTDAITVAPTAQLILENAASLVQVNEATNTGSITAERITTPMKKYDFTYWSSPVSGQILHDLSPNTLADKYYSFSPAIGNWVSHLYGAVTMEAAKGYIVRAPQSFSATVPANFTTSFTGTPNNGSISTPIGIGNSDMNLIGNPYPSAIDVDVFLSDPANAALIGGTIYLWTHNSGPAPIPGDNQYNYTSNDYAAYNILGGLATSTLGNNERPNGNVASGQSFFIKGTNPGSVVFRNDMRVAFSNGQFFRNNQVATAEKHRLWISISNNQGAFKETLLGYMDGATNGIDRSCDGVAFNGNTFLDFYSLVGATHLSIQGRALPFDANQTVPMGYNTTVAGSFSIALDEFDGLFIDQEVYVYDAVTDVLHNLKNGAYNFDTAIGTFNNRFEMRFVNTALGTTVYTESQPQITVKQQVVYVQTAAPMQAVSVYDLSGRCVYQADAIDADHLEIPSLFQKGVFIIVIKLGDNTFVEKIMM